MSTVVVIEEDAGMQMLIREWLEAAGYRVGSAAADLVIVDLPHLRLRGAQAARDVAARFPHAALIGMSTQLGHSLPGDSALAVALGMGRLIAKPLARDELLAAVSDAIGPAR